MVDYGISKPTNAIVERGDALVEELRIETNTNCYPGRLVKKGTTDADCVVNTVNNMPIGVLGYEHAQGQNQPADVDTLYTQYDHAPVLKGDINCVLSLKATEVATKGDGLYPAASGEVATWASGSTIIAIAEQSISYGASSQDIVAKMLI